MKVHAIQLDCAWEDKPSSFQKARTLVQAAHVAAGDFVVLPEMFSTGFTLDTKISSQSAAREDEGFLAGLAQELQCCVMGGVVSPAEGKPLNEAVAFAPDGSLLCRYAKQQPFTFGGESAVHGRGSRPTRFEWGGFRIAPLICYDLRFPELARAAVAQGVDMLVYIASWPIKRQQHWITLLQARAIENLAFVVGVNRCGQDPQFTYSGRSLVVDPHGIIIADAAEREGVASVECLPAVAQAWRRDFPALQDAGITV
ncbi:MAG: carbon-nitrogen family hydrolase [Verrucomicrobiales bacterium]|nr:carbon-nitrogen family hydrolase [Verrucomicrobiales bacterium]MCP5560906.1 carbon-nitrogen family hydrolase [Verrucomicrobiaceae bacterium]